MSSANKAVISNAQLAQLTVGMICLGCSKNLVDSETIAAHILAAGFHFAACPEEADIVLINTCAFIRDAQQESIAAILEVCNWKAAGSACRAIVVCGCLPQRYHNEIAESLPEVDAFIGLDALPEIGLVLRRVAQGERAICHITRHARRVIEPPLGRPIFTDGPYAWIKIAEGCNNRCRYCAIPMIRGVYRSRPLSAIVREAESLLQHGIREINLIAQDITAYGSDLKSSVDLPKLLRALDAIGGEFWIRLLYAHPAHITDDILEAIAACSRVCRYLDLPIQHSHPNILAAMGRPIPPEGMEGLFEKIRRFLPEITLRTTCMVGFPGETERRFAHLLDFTAAVRFDHLGVFMYSPEQGTPAAKLARRIAARTVAQRERQLMLQQQKIVRENNKSLIGKTATMLVEAPVPRRPQTMRARSAACAPEVDGVTYLVQTPPNCQPGQFIHARYLRASGYDMEAVIV